MTTSPRPTVTPATLTTLTVPSRTRPVSGTAPAVTEPLTVHDEPPGRTASASVIDTEPRAGVLEDVDVVIRRRPSRHVEAVDDDAVGAGRGVADGHRLLGVAVSALRNGRAGRRTALDEQIEVGRRVRRAADGRTERRRACRNRRVVVLDLVVRDAEHTSSGATESGASGPAGERREVVRERVRPRHRNADLRGRNDVRVRRDADAEERRRQRERRVCDVRRAPGLDGHFPHTAVASAAVRLSGSPVEQPAMTGT